MACRPRFHPLHRLIPDLGDRLTVLEIVLLTLLVLTLALGPYTLFKSQERTPLSSAETRFVETSPSGMQIVPASCPSQPHYTGECSGAPPPARNGHCSINARSEEHTSE